MAPKKQEFVLKDDDDDDISEGEDHPATISTFKLLFIFLFYLGTVHKLLVGSEKGKVVYFFSLLNINIVMSKKMSFVQAMDHKGESSICNHVSVSGLYF